LEAPDPEIDRLYGLPLDEFVGQRDALAKRLRSGGDRDAAAMVKALRKPTAGAWALNQAVRRRRSETQQLLAAGERLRGAHSALLSGGDRAELRAAMDDQRRLAAALADCAEAIASETGKSGPALKERVRSTLHAAAIDDEVREQLAAGRLVREREAVGLGSGFGATEAGATATSAPPTPDRSADRTAAKRRAEAERLLDEAETAVKQSEADLDQASGRVERARGELKEAENTRREAGKLLRARQGERAKRERELRRLQE
jgi:hypothetical protein